MNQRKGACAIKGDEKILAALLESRTITEAADKCGMSRATIYRRLKDPAFAERYYRARDEMLIVHAANLQGLLEMSVLTFRQAMADKNAPQQTRVSAADSVIRNCLKLRESVDFEKRLKAIEEKLGDDS